MRVVVAALIGIAVTMVGQRALAQSPAAPARTILAIGAHAGDAELTSGLLLAKQRRLGDFSALMTVRGAESRRGRAVAVDIDQIGKRRVIDSLP